MDAKAEIMISCKSLERVDSCISGNNEKYCGATKNHKLDGTQTTLYKLVEEDKGYEIYERNKGQWIVWEKTSLGKNPIHSEKRVDSNSAFLRVVYEDYNNLDSVILAYTAWVEFLKPELGKEVRTRILNGNVDITEWVFDCEEFKN